MSKVREGLIITHPNLGEGKFLVTKFMEQQPQITFGNRSSSYENVILLQKLQDGNYNEDAPIIKATSCIVYSEECYKYLDESNIGIVGKMKKTWVSD